MKSFDDFKLFVTSENMNEKLNHILSSQEYDVSLPKNFTKSMFNDLMSAVSTVSFQTTLQLLELYHQWADSQEKL